jgi:hypothetical protein
METTTREDFHRAAFLAAMQGDWANSYRGCFNNTTPDGAFIDSAEFYKRAADAAVKVYYGDGSADLREATTRVRVLNLKGDRVSEIICRKCGLKAHNVHVKA